uniref:Uncharacterized protein n=1 Tax=Manihot esculenta TaxID=3983 RepID=A0A2C9WK99_MANES
MFEIMIMRISRQKVSAIANFIIILTITLELCHCMII